MMWHYFMLLGPNPCDNKLRCDDHRCIPIDWCCDTIHDSNCTARVLPPCCLQLSKCESSKEITNLLHNCIFYISIKCRPNSCGNLIANPNSTLFDLFTVAAECTCKWVLLPGVLCTWFIIFGLIVSAVIIQYVYKFISKLYISFRNSLNCVHILTISGFKN